MAAAAAGGVSADSSSRRARLDEPGREPGVDLARGLAVFGMFAAHVVVTPDAFRGADPSTWLAAVHGNSSILFATLAGVSLALVTGGSEPIAGARLRTARQRIAIRAALILVIGVVLWLLPAPVYVILPAYAILFVIALPLLRWRPLPLLALAAGVAAVSPFLVQRVDGWSFWTSESGRVVAALFGWHYPFLAWIAFVLTGLALVRAGGVGPARAAIAGAIGAAVSYVGFGIIGAGASPESALSAEPHSTGMGEIVGSGGLAVVVICVCVLVGRTPARWLLWPIRAVGSMPLTAYTAQLVAWSIWIWVAENDGSAVSRLYDFQEADPFWPLAIGTIVACSVWAALLGRGPLEAAIAGAARAAVPGPAPTPR
ncbi:heparan-alpha-glucosaminide N-acetyltransferase domain-containing protein [Microbacterium sp. G2-8]|uniref:heparan-alpha-glucosaminide N-acetyltransferase domain-containing protein n=1 Tax=Microbacterium sp. G2-8 TaxID=2842454 RepID=UPI0027E2B62D|nr:heparan-alpha-glucosaminide N-acetyltransferase domain-containing protein [Microbacterium sp. G2-8]